MTSAITHGVAAGAYLLLTAFLLSGWRRRGFGFALIGATALTALWSGLAAASAAIDSAPLATSVSLSEFVRTGAWILFMLVIRDLPEEGGASARLWRDPLAIAGFALVCLGIADTALDGSPTDGVDAVLDLTLFARLGLAVLGLLLVENLFVQTRGGSRWAFKHLLIGLGGLFAFDLFLYSEALLFKQIDTAIAAARPLVNAAVAPFILVAAARIQRLSFDVGVSRAAVLQTTALIGSGLYLLGVAAIGYLMRELNLTWGPVLQILFLFGALMLLAVLLLSGQIRARAKMFIAQNFFSFAYDYRHEWLRFIRTMSATDEGDPLYNRAVDAVADVFECSAGALYLRGRGDLYTLAGRRQWGNAESSGPLPAALVERMQHCDTVLNLRDGADLPTDGAAAEPVAAWMRQIDDPWLLLPLRVRGRTVGAILLGRPRAPRELNWEDEDMLDILGVQIGSYIAEDQATRALIEAQRFERLSKRFSFVAHDLKNLVSQLSMILQYAERHGNNPEFQQDVLETVRGSVEKMRAMLVRLRESTDAETAGEPVAVAPLLHELLMRKRALRGVLQVGTIEEDVRVRADRTALTGIIENLVQNALEAAGQAGRIEVNFRARRGEALIEIKDNGPGMSQSFIEHELFAPFASTKGGGFGIGMYQARELMEGWGGRIEVESEVGVGTTMRLLLPLAAGDGALPAIASPEKEGVKAKA